MIPKIIHYCWFGGKELPEDAKKCIQSWQKFLPEYEIIKWDEENFDINSNKFVKEAYQAKKFAFVTDFVRLYALYNFGGVYMDTDVEALASFDEFLLHNAFSGFENNNMVPTGMMASEKGGKWVSELLETYKNRSFFLSDGSLNMVSNTKLITDYMIKKGLKQNNSFQDFPGLVTLYPSEYFCPKDHATGSINLTENSKCIHHFAASWIPRNSWVWRRHALKLFFIKIFGINSVKSLCNLINFSK